jgi:hypothetical protein
MKRESSIPRLIDSASGRRIWSLEVVRAGGEAEVLGSVQTEVTHHLWE